MTSLLESAIVILGRDAECQPIQAGTLQTSFRAINYQNVIAINTHVTMRKKVTWAVSPGEEIQRLVRSKEPFENALKKK
jgi:hypothetical protein